MNPNLQMHFLQSVEIQQKFHIETDMLRLDLIHPIISGNKWFKLRYYIEEAFQKSNSGIVTAGGPYSNHLVATAHLCKLMGIQSKGLVRGYANAPRTHTLLQAEYDGMELEFISKKDFDTPNFLESNFLTKNDYWIPMGGKGGLGVKGFDIIADMYPLEKYSHIICAVGTGTMMAGILNTAKPHQHVIGIAAHNEVQPINIFLEEFVETHSVKAAYSLFEKYHEGGFAKKSFNLIEVIKEVWNIHKIPLDFVYTAKLWMGYQDLLVKGFFNSNSKILLIHSGGLQGNLSLPKNALPF
ncbi:MAG: pyridoxal-phosphate dependent enzyme [Hydrotalea sp.]|nr:pyridoxal-phosphate dependent enzyme [Hydrotalea sp.]